MQSRRQIHVVRTAESLFLDFRAWPKTTANLSELAAAATCIANHQSRHAIEPIKQFSRRLSPTHFAPDGGLVRERFGDQPAETIVALVAANADNQRASRSALGRSTSGANDGSRSILIFKKCVEQLMHGS